MSTFIKSLNKTDSKFSVNGKLCILQYGPNKSVESIKYSSELNPDEEKDFKQHLESIKKIV